MCQTNELLLSVTRETYNGICLCLFLSFLCMFDDLRIFPHHPPCIMCAQIQKEEEEKKTKKVSITILTPTHFISNENSLELFSGSLKILFLKKSFSFI